MYKKALENNLGKILSQDSSKLLIVRDFIFLYGEVNKKLLLDLDREYKKDYGILVALNEDWEKLIRETFVNRIEEIERYKMDGASLDKKELSKLLETLDPSYRIQEINRDIFYKLRQEDWSYDLVSLTSDYEEYLRENLLGYVILDGENIVSGASTYLAYKGGIEIQIDTKQSYQRKGLGKIIGAKLVLESLNQGLTPYWDAHSKASLKLAQSLGYKLDYPYRAYELYS